MKKLISILIVLLVILTCTMVFAADVVADPAVQASTLTIILGAVAAVSEALALIPGLKSNSIFQLVVNIVKALLGKSTGI